MIVLGTKYQCYVDDELVIFRVMNAKRDGYTVVSNTNDVVFMTEEELTTKCVRLEPDAVLNLFIARHKEDPDADDVCGFLHLVEDMKEKMQIPNLVVSQYALNNSTQAAGIMGLMNIYMGDCFADPDPRKMEDYVNNIKFDSISDQLSVAIYIEDKLKDVMKVIGHKSRKFDLQLRTINNYIKSNPGAQYISGTTESLEELLKSTKFIERFRMLFRIDTIDFPIDLGNNVNEDGNVTLNVKQLERLQDMLNATITNVTCVKYDKDLDIGKFINHTHIMISDTNEDIFLLVYTVIKMRVDEDIAKAMMQ